MARKIKAEKPQNQTPPSPTVEEIDENYTAFPASSDATIPNTDPIMPEVMDTSDDTVVGQTDSLNVLGRGVKELVQAVQDLRHLGVEDLVLPLPKIVVVGDQSTGKSSLIEAMSEIKVPRADGTCTRCPIEINLTEGSKWSCKVSLRHIYMYTGQLDPKAGRIEAPTRKRPLGPWIKQDIEEFPFAMIDTPSEVAHVLALAQLAILNPGENPLKYSYTPGKAKPPSNYQVKFSPNIVRLDICGQGLPNLSFTDLPGVINVTDNPRDSYLVDLVKNLVKDYVCTEDCINLLAIPMSDDPANSTASRLLRDLKADVRTVGCITKPDRFEPEKSPEQWVKILQGQQFSLGHGYYVIKNNSDSSVDHAIARAEEKAFFEEDLWSNVLSAHQARFGTVQLQTALSQLLTRQIQTSLPRIQEQVQDKAKYIDTELKTLPAPTEGNLPVIVAEELSRFSIQLQKHIDGGSQSCPFQKDFHEMTTQFRQSLADSKPILKLRDGFSMLPIRQTPDSSGSPCPLPRGRGLQNVNPVIDVSDDEDDLPTQRQPVQRSGNKRPNRALLESPSKLLRMEDNTANHQPPGTQGIISKCFTLLEVRNIIQQGYLSLPGQVDPKAVEELIRLSMEHWKTPLEDFSSQVKILCENTVREQIEDVFGHRRQTKYYNEIWEASRSFLEGVCTEQLQISRRILAWELSKPKTLNEQAIDIARTRATTLLLSQRRKVLAERYLDEQEERFAKKSTGHSRDEKLAKVPDSELVPETFGPELKAIAETKAYYEVAYSRFVDNLYTSIHYELFTKCREQLVYSLKQKFGLLNADASDRLAVLLAINAEDEMRRNVLNKEKATIAQAIKQLQALS